jgi:hypothetical protein
LNESSKESINKSSTGVYKYTQIYKLQYELLSTLGVIAQLLKLREQELWQILTNTQMYLNARQNIALQVSVKHICMCICIFEHLLFFKYI